MLRLRIARPTKGRQGLPHLSSYELVGHAQDEVGPEDMQHLQHGHHEVKEVVAKEGGVELQRVHQRAVQDPKGLGQSRRHGHG